MARCSQRKSTYALLPTCNALEGKEAGAGDVVAPVRKGFGGGEDARAVGRLSERLQNCLQPAKDSPHILKP